MYYGDVWDPTNDWSYQDLTMFTDDDAFFGNGNEQKTSYICVYDDGVLVGGIEPDGTTPASNQPDTTTVPTTGTTTGAPDDDILYGDANGDGDVTVADPTLIMQSAANPDEYSVKAENKANADCENVGDGITPADALAIQKFLTDPSYALPVA